MEGSGAGGAVVGKVGVVFKGECHFEISPAVVIVMMAARRLSPRFAVFGNIYSSGPGNPDGGFGEMVSGESLTSRIIQATLGMRCNTKYKPSGPTTQNALRSPQTSATILYGEGWAHANRPSTLSRSR